MTSQRPLPDLFREPERRHPLWLRILFLAGAWCASRPAWSAGSSRWSPASLLRRRPRVPGARQRPGAALGQSARAPLAEGTRRKIRSLLAKVPGGWVRRLIHIPEKSASLDSAGRPPSRGLLVLPDPAWAADAPASEEGQALDIRRLAPEQRRRLLAGDTIAYQVAETSETELGAGVAMYVAVPLARAAEVLTSADVVLKDPSITASGRIPRRRHRGRPPRLQALLRRDRRGAGRARRRGGLAVQPRRCPRSTLPRGHGHGTRPATAPRCWTRRPGSGARSSCERAQAFQDARPRRRRPLRAPQRHERSGRAAPRGRGGRAPRRAAGPAPRRGPAALSRRPELRPRSARCTG